MAQRVGEWRPWRIKRLRRFLSALNPKRGGGISASPFRFWKASGLASGLRQIRPIRLLKRIALNGFLGGGLFKSRSERSHVEPRTFSHGAIQARALPR